MTLKELLEKRYSVRAYLTKDVEPEKLDYILECARLAPSACNLQPWYFYVVKDSEARAGVRKAYDRQWMADAPVYIIVCKDSSQSWKRSSDGKDSGDIDAAIVSEHICLAAAELGLGTCWVCNFNLPLLTEVLHIASEQEAIAIFPIGYVDEAKSQIPEKKRKALSEIVRCI